MDDKLFFTQDDLILHCAVEPRDRVGFGDYKMVSHEEELCILIETENSDFWADGPDETCVVLSVEDEERLLEFLKQRHERRSKS